MSEHMAREPFDPEWTCALAIRLINLGWFRVGTERYTRTTRTFGITTLRKSHVSVRGSRISFRYRGKHRAWVRTAVVDEELASAMKEVLELPGGRQLFRYRYEDSFVNLTGARLNEYINEHLGEEFTAKDFRTWGGTLLAAIALAEHGPAETEAKARRAVAGVMRAVGERLGNTPAVARSSYVSPAVVEQYLDARTIDDFRPRLCASSEHAIPGSIARSVRCSVCCVRGEFDARELPRELPTPFRYAPLSPFILFRRQYQWHERPFSFATSVVERWAKARARHCG